MAEVVSSADPPKSSEQNEINQQDSDPNMESSPPTKQAIDQVAGTSNSTKKPSRWKNMKNFLMTKKSNDRSSKPYFKSNQIEASSASTEAEELIKSIESSIDDISKHGEGPDKQSELIRDHLHSLRILFNVLKKAYIDEGGKDDDLRKLHDLRRDLIKLKLAVPAKEKDGASKNDPLENLKFTAIEADKSNYREVLNNKMPRVHQNPVFGSCMEFKEFVARFENLCRDEKLCLLCFSIFPVGAIIKKRLMVQWWMTEGYAPSEEVAGGRFQLLIEKGFIEAVNDNRSFYIGSCRIHPFNRLSLVVLAWKANFFNFGGRGNPKQEFSDCFQSCLMGEGLISYKEFKKKRDEKMEEKKGVDTEQVIKGLIDDLEKLHLLMNVDEHILEFKHEWFGKMKNVNVLYLGRWKADATHHIEVEDKVFLEKGLKNMKYVKLLSLQGVSNIISLPDSTLNITNLEVLDLRACYNLETIPENIGRWLKMLTHLDMSECYLLEHMPKSLKELKNLKVLKGFFVGDEKKKTGRLKPHCTIGDLKDLKKLEKLCIYTNSKEFPSVKDITDLEKLARLKKLSITWGVAVSSKDKNKNKQESSTREEGKLPKSLMKLDLKCFPMSVTPYWLKLQNLEHTELKKLYIRGGKFRDVGQWEGNDKKWNHVEVLRLKYLEEIDMEWRRIQDLFPQLKYLEQVKCPGLTFVPCDAKGVWIKPE